MTDWSKAKVVDLRAELKKRGLQQTGLKPALVERLTAAENEDGTESEATIQGDGFKLSASAATSPDTVSPTQPQSAENLSGAVHVTSEPNPKSTEGAAASTTYSMNGIVDISITADLDESLPTRSAKSIESSQVISHLELERSEPLQVGSEEAIEDRQKRKRRSQTPPVSSADAARKRFRQSDKPQAASDGVSEIRSSSTEIEKNNVVDEAGVKVPSGESFEVVQEEVSIQGGDGDGDNTVVEMNANVEQAQTSSDALDDSSSRTRDSRYKDLFTSPRSAPTMALRMEKSRSRDTACDKAEPERVISPALHPATAALYIRDFMRPLNPAQLKSYLAELATPPGCDVETDVVVDFYLDPIRTHAFVSFKNISAASRVRSALHDRTWPDERTRKALWVDFIPSDTIKEWIEVEESNNSAGRGLGKKWEVYYDIDEERHVTASLQETSNIPKSQHNRKLSSQPTPQAPPIPTSAHVSRRGIEGAPSGPRAEQSREHTRENGAKNLATLDQLFRSTTAKPVLYWEPVPRSIANKRLDAMHEAASKRYVRGGQVDDDINRYTFEDGDNLVDRGPELFGGIRPPRGFRGPGRGGTSRVPSTRGGYNGGGERIDRAYDSYRGMRGSRDNYGGRRDERRY